ELRIVGRDDNESLMDQYLTNGSRSIPIMIGLDNQFKEVFRWGPRPTILAEKIKDWKESGLEKKEMGLLMHQWYTENKGQSVWQEWEAM
ncbi:MAG: thioredoxin family protein, partial [Bacteroidetes bacterium]|nr:thioredoxin family protein [Bacteroidota bacterium]